MWSEINKYPIGSFSKELKNLLVITGKNDVDPADFIKNSFTMPWHFEYKLKSFF